MNSIDQDTNSSTELDSSDDVTNVQDILDRPKPDNPPNISVRYSILTTEDNPDLLVSKLTVEVVDSVNCPKEIFVFHRGPSTIEGDIIDEFSHIATPLDLEELPAKAPSLELQTPYYREKKVTLYFRTIADLELAKKAFKRDIRKLIEAHTILNSSNLHQETETYAR